jgi:hypothetical protein
MLIAHRMALLVHDGLLRELCHQSGNFFLCECLTDRPRSILCGDRAPDKHGRILETNSLLRLGVLILRARSRSLHDRLWKGCSRGGLHLVSKNQQGGPTTGASRGWLPTTNTGVMPFLGRLLAQSKSGSRRGRELVGGGLAVCRKSC